MSSEKTTMVSLRGRYGDRVHPLSVLEIRLQGVMVRAEYIDTDGFGRRGVFRLHPRLPALQIWPNLDTANEYLRSLSQADEKIIRSIEQLRRVREAEEALVKARSRGEPPRREDWLVAQEARTPPIKSGLSREKETTGGMVTLKEIDQAVASSKVEILRKQRALPREPVKVQLKPGTPIQLKSRASILLVVQFE